jgi:hypothetical protein
MLVRTQSRDSTEKIKSNPQKTWHYTFAKTPPHTEQNQGLTPRSPAQTVEDGAEPGSWADASAKFDGFVKGAHRSRATSLLRTSQSAAAWAPSMPSVSSLRTVVLSMATFFISRYRSTRTPCFKDGHGGLRSQRSCRRASTPKPRRKKTCRTRPTKPHIRTY